MSVELNYSEAVDLLHRAVNERGADYVYQKGEVDGITTGCAYFHDDRPGCIIGMVLHYKGVTREDLGEFNAESAVDTLVEQDILVVDGRTEALLCHVQALQDHGKAWGEAVEKGIRGSRWIRT